MLDKVTKGQPFTPPKAATWNSIIEATDAFKNRDSRTQGPPLDKMRESGIVYVKNGLDDAVEAFNAVAVESPITAPSDLESVFKYSFTCNLRKPTADDVGKWMVLQRKTPHDTFGVAIAIGVTVCKVNILTAGDTHVEIEADNFIPQGAAAGAAQILWVAGGVGTASSTGEQYALIKLGGGSSEQSVGEFQHQNYYMVSANQSGWSFQRAHGLP